MGGSWKFVFLKGMNVIMTIFQLPTNTDGMNNTTNQGNLHTRMLMFYNVNIKSCFLVLMAHL